MHPICAVATPIYIVIANLTNPTNFTLLEYEYSRWLLLIRQHFHKL